MAKIFLSVIIPAYNEVKNFDSGNLNHVYEYLNSQNYRFEIILVDDGSTDNTLELLKIFAKDKPEVKILAEGHKGKGAAVRAGMLAARGENRLFTDFDQSTPIGEVDKLLTFRAKNYDVVIGSREVKGALRDDEPWYRHIMGRGFNYLVRLLTVGGIMDTQCGFKMLSAAAAKQLFPKLIVCVDDTEIKLPFTGAFDVELLYLAYKHKFIIAEVPVAWKHVKTARVNPVRDSLKMFWQVVMIRLADLKGLYNKA